MERGAFLRIIFKEGTMEQATLDVVSNCSGDARYVATFLSGFLVAQKSSACMHCFQRVLSV